MKDLRRVRRSGITLFVFTGMVALGAAPKAHAQPQCSNASVRGSYGYHALATIVPAGTLRTIIGVFQFDGHGNWTASLTINDNGVISRRPSEGGTYIVNPDWTGALSPNSGGTVEIVVVDDGREVYQMRTEPNTILLYSVTKKIFPGFTQ